MGSAMRRVATTVGAMVGGLALLTGTASAHYCIVADKPEGAGAVTFDDVTFNPQGHWVVPGAFYETGEGDVFIRGGGEKQPGSWEVQFGMGTDQAICNGSTEHGIVDGFGHAEC